MNQMKKYLSLTGYIMIIGLIFLPVSCKTKKSESTPRNSASGLIVDVIIVKPVRLEENVFATANLLSFEEVEIKAPVTGTVLAINFQEGQYVKKGQVLLKIDDRNWKAQIKGATAQLINAKNELSRKKELVKVGGASQQDVDNAQAAVNALEAQIEQFSVYVSLANIVAPFEGKVGMRNFSLGSFLSQGQTITVLAQAEKLKVDFNISSRYLDKVQVGNMIYVISSSDTLEASIYAINPTVSQTSRTIQIRALIDNNSKNFMPGDFAEVVVPVKTEADALVVPANCIVPELNAQIIYFYKNGRTLRREIIPGIRTDKVVQILTGLSPGDTVITTGLVQIKDKMPVQIGNISESPTL
jgi:membrane fusion protein (multidrug efflux system)